MSSFDFITNDDLRASLESDYREMGAAMDSRAYKAVHVLAGSIVEAVLADYLITIDYQSKSGKDPLKMMLDEIIKTCRSENIISKRVGDLSTVVQSYRNLIHPARMIRLNEKIDENGAKVAQALVEMIVDEISNQRKRTYGYTANQVIEKIKNDPSVQPILGDILRETNKIELQKILDLIPKRHGEPISEESSFDEDYNYQKRLEYCYRVTLDMVPEQAKKQIAQRFVQIIKTASERSVTSYGDAFFEAHYLQYLNTEDIDLAKRHIIHRLQDVIQSRSSLAEGLGAFLDVRDATVFVDSAIKAQPQHDGDWEAVSFIEREYYNMKDEVKQAMVARLEEVVGAYTGKRLPMFAYIAKQVLDRITLSDEDIPF